MIAILGDDVISVVADIERKKNITKAELQYLLEGNERELLGQRAAAVRQEIYGQAVFIRGLIEFTNYCKNNCYYCGIRRGNKSAVRYRLTKDDILACCEEGYKLGFRTFVMQGGEDPYYTDDVMCSIVSAVRERYSDCAITL